MANTVPCYTCLLDLTVDQQHVFDCGNNHPDRLCLGCGENWLRRTQTCPHCRQPITRVVLAQQPVAAEEAPPAVAQPLPLAEAVANMLQAMGHTLNEQRRFEDENQRLRNLVARQHEEMEQLRNRILLLEDELARSQLANDNLHGRLDNIRAMIPGNRREREEQLQVPRPRAKAKRVGRVVDVDNE